MICPHCNKEIIDGCCGCEGPVCRLYKCKVCGKVFTGNPTTKYKQCPNCAMLGERVD